MILYTLKASYSIHAEPGLQTLQQWAQRLFGKVRMISEQGVLLCIEA